MKKLFSTFPLPNRLTYRYLELKAIQPDDESIVSVYDKNTGTYRNKNVFRTYRSYGVSPAFDLHTAKSYMFNNQIAQLPNELKPFMAFAKTLDSRYNNCYVNWYDSGANHIEPHSDCTAKMVPDSKILIMNLNESWYERTFKMEHKRHVGQTHQITLNHGICIELDSSEQEEFRHWVEPENTDQGRISLTFRMIKE